MTAARSGFKRGDGENPGDQVRIPTAGERYGLGETSASLGHVAVQYLVMKDRGYSQPRVFNQPFLHRVSEDGSLARVHTLVLSGNLPDPVL